MTREEKIDLLQGISAGSVDPKSLVVVRLEFEELFQLKTLETKSRKEVLSTNERQVLDALIRKTTGRRIDIQHLTREQLYLLKYGTEHQA